jgi:hypothetical protein
MGRDVEAVFAAWISFRLCWNQTHVAHPYTALKEVVFRHSVMLGGPPSVWSIFGHRFRFRFRPSTTRLSVPQSTGSVRFGWVRHVNIHIRIVLDLTCIFFFFFFFEHTFAISHQRNPYSVHVATPTAKPCAWFDRRMKGATHTRVRQSTQPGGRAQAPYFKYSRGCHGRLARYLSAT